MAQQVKKPISIHEETGSIPVLAQWSGKRGHFDQG